MALNQLHSWIVAYDIADRRRLARVHKFVKKHAIPVQYSLYLTRQSGMAIGRLAGEIDELIEKREDDVRIYQIPAHPQSFHFGKSELPEHGVGIFGELGSMVNLIDGSGA